MYIKIMKQIVFIVIGAILGIVGMVLIFRPPLLQNQLGWDLMLEHTQVRDFVMLNNRNDKFRYCFEYSVAKSNVKGLEKRLSELNRRNVSVILKMNIEWAEEAIEGFKTIDEDKLQYDCENT